MLQRDLYETYQWTRRGATYKADAEKVCSLLEVVRRRCFIGIKRLMMTMTFQCSRTAVHGLHSRDRVANAQWTSTLRNGGHAAGDEERI